MEIRFVVISNRKNKIRFNELVFLHILIFIDNETAEKNSFN